MGSQRVRHAWVTNTHTHTYALIINHTNAGQEESVCVCIYMSYKSCLQLFTETVVLDISLNETKPLPNETYIVEDR